MIARPVTSYDIGRQSVPVSDRHLVDTGDTPARRKYQPSRRHSPLNPGRPTRRPLRRRLRSSRLRLRGRSPRLDWPPSRHRDARISWTRSSVLGGRRLRLHVDTTVSSVEGTRASSDGQAGMGRTIEEFIDVWVEAFLFSGI